MIQKGIIAQVIDKYNYKVRIPKYDKVESATYSTKTDDLSSGIVCTVPGIEVVYVEGDVVLLSFENGELSKPVILGLLYREEKKDSDILVNGVDKSLSGIKEDIDKLNSQSLYTHLKYSDDNGITFTSLFSSQNYESIVGGEVVCQPYFDDDSTIGIKIDKATKAISWSILDENNQDITDEIEIETIVFDSNKNIIKRYRSRENRLITINNSSQIDGELYLTYRIFTSKVYLDTLHIRLSSDKEPFGVRVGDYVGLYLSFNSTPSTTPSDYSWFPIASGAAIDAEINRKIAALTAEMTDLLNEFKEEVDENFVTIFYRDVNWTQAQVDTYCQPGYEGTWERDPISGYMDEVKTGNTLYISVHNTGESDSTGDDSYGQLQIRATADAAAGQDVEGAVIAYIVSGEIALDALARFKSSLLQPGDETLIYGGHITTGRIQDSTGKNFIQLSAEERAPAGQVEFKNQDTWANSNQGLQWDSNQGQLNVKGNINASSLTIVSGNSSYDGAAAINISGYDIEIIKDSVDVEEDVSVYLYPVLYHNGEKVPDYIQSTDTSVDSSKTYYTRSGSAGSYVYTEVTNPSGNPSQIPYYEKQIDYSHFLWYQDDSEISTAGDANNRGRYLATYSHNYRVTYDFDDGAVGGGTEIQTRYVDPQKYITKVNDYDITVHPESYQNVSSYIQLNQNGLNVFNSDGNSIAQYGSTARVGLNNSSRFLMNNNSLQAYDNNNIKYFEVSSSGLTWGSQAAATTQQVSNLSSQLAGKANTSDVNQAVSNLEDAIDLKADSADVPTSVTDLSDGANYSTTSQMNTAIGSAVSGKADIEDIPTSVTDLSDGADYSTTTQMNSAIGTAVGNLSTPIADAAKTATSYITTITGGGISVHDENDEDNYAKIDADGLEVFNDVDNVSTSVAKFGATSRIGEIAGKTPHIEMNNKFMEISNNEKSYFGAGFVNQSAGIIRIPFEAKYCEGTTTKTITTNCTINTINEIEAFSDYGKLIPLIPNLHYTFTPGSKTITLMNLADYGVDTEFEFYLDYNTAQFASLQGTYAPILNEYNSFFGTTYYPEHTIAGLISARVDSFEVPSISYTINQDGSITFDSVIGINDSHFIYISYVTSDTLFAITSEDQTGAIGINSVSFGKGNVVSGGYSAAIGKGLTTIANNQTALGKYNKCMPDSLLMVGNGDEPLGLELCLTLSSASNHPVLKMDLSRVSDTIQGGSFYFTTPDQKKWFCDIPWYDPDEPIVTVTDWALRVDDTTISFDTVAAVDSIEIIAVLISQHADQGEHNIYLDSDINTIPATNTPTTIYATMAPVESNTFEVKTNGDVYVGSDLYIGSSYADGGLNISEPEWITPTYSQCTAGGYNKCYRLGQIVFLSFNINVTTATSGYGYITGLPPALDGNWACAGSHASGSVSRWFVNELGELHADGTATAGWHNGSIAYLCNRYMLEGE